MGIKMNIYGPQRFNKMLNVIMENDIDAKISFATMEIVIDEPVTEDEAFILGLRRCVDCERYFDTFAYPKKRCPVCEDNNHKYHVEVKINDGSGETTIRGSMKQPFKILQNMEYYQFV